MGGIVAGAIFLLTVISPILKDETKSTPPPQNHISQTSTTIKSPSPTPQLPKIHTVVSGDTLYSIARKYTEVKEIRGSEVEDN